MHNYINLNYEMSSRDDIDRSTKMFINVIDKDKLSESHNLKNRVTLTMTLLQP